MLYLRPWKLNDASFVLKLRNDPEYMQYFRQSEPISLANQLKFMKKADSINYKGNVLVDEKGTKLGVFALHGSELCVVSPLKYHAIGVNILKAANPHTMIFGDVFTYNPALPIYLTECGFHIFAVKEKYYKKNNGWVSAVKISSL